MDEAEAGSAGAPDNRGRGQGSAGDGSPFQARAVFLENWDWEFVVRINQGACPRGQAQHGFGSETGTACEESWRLVFRTSMEPSFPTWFEILRGLLGYAVVGLLVIVAFWILCLMAFVVVAGLLSRGLPV